jgi:PAS domain S-box-containing protein
MTEKDQLRRQAESRLALAPDASAALTPEEARRTLHELKVHQIELEMQNEELRRAHAELDATRARYFDLYDLAPVGYCTLSEKGLILEANLTAATLLGVTRNALVKRPFSQFILKDDQDIYYQHRKALLATDEPQTCELRMVKTDGTSFWARLEGTAARDGAGAPVCRVMLIDVTERKFQEDERALTARLIVQVNAPGDFRACMSALTASLQGWSGCEAVAIRLRAGDDYPYYETCGFPPAFVCEETHLCAHDQNGDVLRDAAGAPVLECMCGVVLSGRFDPTQPFFTAHGSFWTNTTTALLASTTAADRQARPRNRCNRDGYESVALIPLRIGTQVFGLIQFNDHQPGRFTPEQITHFERMADSLAIALSRRQDAEALRASEAQYRRLYENMTDGFALHEIICDQDGNPDDYRFLAVNPAFERMTGLSAEAIVGRTVLEVLPGTEQYWIDAYGKVALTGEPAYIEHYSAELDKHFVVRAFRPAKNQFACVVSDITDRKRAEAEQQQIQNLQSIGTLAGGIAHDFNNILMGVFGNISLAKEELAHDHPGYHLLAEAEKSINRAVRLTVRIA